MLKKSKIAKEVHILEEEIKLLEIRRSRSMAVILEGLINKKEPNDDDVQFFRTYTAEIDVKREQLQQLTEQLEGKR